MMFSVVMQASRTWWPSRIVKPSKGPVMKGCTWYGCDLSTNVSGANVGRSQKGFSLNALPGSSIRLPLDRMGFVQELAAITIRTEVIQYRSHKGHSIAFSSSKARVTLDFSSTKVPPFARVLLCHWHKYVLLEDQSMCVFRETGRRDSEPK
jgi:hypothetical protein